MHESMLLLLQGLHQKGDVQRSLLLEKKQGYAWENVHPMQMKSMLAIFTM